MTEAEKALRIKVFRNGDERYTGKYFILNRRRIRTWDSFLQAVTLDVKSTEAVRSIRTPLHGSRIESLEQLTEKGQNQEYVAVGNGRFKKLG
ncbi:hypothetical protein NP493_74g04012 [Ridgeia piscesae]|uniref:Doublecortin domain-containing protein n=1 Tax=Ridgeia piscesae TaxID=27915 RepID=A0AAD9UIB4_RIDPI|nr:hypothetical protein NP493_74g04012 [Ridgeia piscesae]